MEFVQQRFQFETAAKVAKKLNTNATVDGVQTKCFVCKTFYCNIYFQQKKTANVLGLNFITVHFVQNSYTVHNRQSIQ